MHIIQTPARFFPATGGVEKYVLNLSSELVKRGHNVKVICANEPSSKITEVQDIRVKRLPYYWKIANTNITFSLFFQLLREDFNLIHTHFPTPWSSELSILAAKIKRKPCLLTYHNDVEKTGLLGLFTRIYNATILKINLALVDKILVTQPHYQLISRMLSPYQNKISVISNGISFTPPSGNFIREPETVLFVSVLDKHHRYKGLEFLIEAIDRIRINKPEIKLEVIGEGELIGEYQTLVQSLQLNNHVIFRGFVDEKKLAEFYRSSAIFVLPSIDMHEGFGIVLLEAMAYGMPVITTDAVGLSLDISANKAGLVVPPKNSFALAKAIIKLIDNPSIAERMGVNGMQLVLDKYLWSEISKSVELIYEELYQ